MTKKLIISENQYEKLKFLILETEFDKLADNVIDNNDVIKILANKNVLSFKVINNTNGQIYMENIDSGSEYFGKLVFLSSTSLNSPLSISTNFLLPPFRKLVLNSSFKAVTSSWVIGLPFRTAFSISLLAS